MGQQQYLIDTNTVIDYLANRLPKKGMVFLNDLIDNVANVSVVTKIEVLGFNAPDEHAKMLYEFIDETTVLELNDNVVNVCIEIRKKHKIKLPDAIIAATAIVYDLTIVSRNISDFKNILDVNIINPHAI